MVQRDALDRGTKTRPLTLARVGAGAYVLWGLAHVGAAYAFYKAALAMPFSDVQGRLMQNAWNIFFAAVAVMAVAVVLNWRNDIRGYWINLVVASVADVGFVVFLMLPGHVPVWPPILVLVLWILGAAFTTVARFGGPASHGSAARAGASLGRPPSGRHAKP